MSDRFGKLGFNKKSYQQNLEAMQRGATGETPEEMQVRLRRDPNFDPRTYNVDQTSDHPAQQANAAKANAIMDQYARQSAQQFPQKAEPTQMDDDTYMQLKKEFDDQELKQKMLEDQMNQQTAAPNPRFKKLLGGS